MRKLFWSIAAAIILLPSVLLAHGGVSNQAGNVVIFLTQSPISPLVGESVTMTFSVTNKNLDPISGAAVNAKIIETNGDDESKDRVIHEEMQAADVNGNFTLTYEFAKATYYDVELSVADPASKETLTIGFLIQPRQPQVPVPYHLFVITALAGALVGYAFAKSKKPIQ